MRLFVRASTLRTSSSTSNPGLRCLGEQGTGGTCTFGTSGGTLSCTGSQGTSGSSRLHYYPNATQGTRGTCNFSIGFLGQQGTSGGCTFGATTAPSYFYNQILVLAQQDDLGSAQFPAVIPMQLSGTALKLKANGGRITDANCYDLIFESLDSPAIQMAHEIDAYDGTAGTLDFILRLEQGTAPTTTGWNPATSQFRFRVRYGATL